MSQKFILDSRNQNDATVRQNAIRAINQAGTKRPEVVEIKGLAKPRTNPQNSTLWGVVYPPLMEFMGLRGERDREDLHEFMCGEFFGWNQTEIMGKKKQRPKRTTTKDEDGRRSILSTLEFQEFCEFIRQRASEHGVVIPDPIPNYLREIAAGGEK